MKKLSKTLLFRPVTFLYCGILLVSSCSKIEDFIGDADPGNGDDAQVSTGFEYRSTIQVGGEGAAEISAYDPKTSKLFTVNAESVEVSVFDISNLDSPTQLASIPLGEGIPNSVAVNDGVLAVALEAPIKQDPGQIVLFNTSTQAQLTSYTVGALPDMVTFSPDGKFIVAACEGEPSGDYAVDPDGAVSIINRITGQVRNLTFEAFEGQRHELIDEGFRVFGPGADLAADVEPEYVVISDDSQTAWVSLQENNGIAKVDLQNQSIIEIFPLGFKDHMDPENKLDPSDRDDVKQLANWPVFGIYHPDGMAYAKISGMDLVITANEGDAREYEDDPGFIEEERIADIVLDPDAFPNAAELQDDAALGRLAMTTTLGDPDMDGDFDELYVFGARSFSIWTGDGSLLYDSGDDIAEQTLALTPERFNDDDGRSDAKGAEPESVAALSLKSNLHLLFVGLERNDQVLVYDISNPVRPEFLYILSHPGDEAPEGLLVIEAKDSPNGKALLLVSNEDSGTVSIYENN